MKSKKQVQKKKLSSLLLFCRDNTSYLINVAVSLAGALRINPEI